MAEKSQEVHALDRNIESMLWKRWLERFWNWLALSASSPLHWWRAVVFFTLTTKF